MLMIRFSSTRTAPTCVTGHSPHLLHSVGHAYVVAIAVYLLSAFKIHEGNVGNFLSRMKGLPVNDPDLPRVPAGVGRCSSPALRVVLRRELFGVGDSWGVPWSYAVVTHASATGSASSSIPRM